MKTPITKAGLKARGLPIPIDRGWESEFYEEDGHVFCRRGPPKDGSRVQTMVCRLGPHPIMKMVCVYWDDA